MRDITLPDRRLGCSLAGVYGTDRPRPRLLQMWNAMTAAAARADRLESGLLPAAQRSSDLDIVHAARTTALTARQAADAAAQLAAAKHSALAAARTAEAEVKKFAPHQGASGEHRTRPEVRGLPSAFSRPESCAPRPPGSPLRKES